VADVNVAEQSNNVRCRVGPSAQLMLTNPHDAFRGQSRSPNIVARVRATDDAVASGRKG